MVRSRKVRWIRFSTLAGFPLGRSPSTSPISRRDLYQCWYCNFEKKYFFLSKAYNESSIIMEAKTDTPTRCVWYQNFWKNKPRSWKYTVQIKMWKCVWNQQYYTLLVFETWFYDYFALLIYAQCFQFRCSFCQIFWCLRQFHR